MVDEAHHLLGIVTVDDVVDVLEEEATEDIYRLAQMSEETVIFSPVPRAIRKRLPWLVVNMGTALISSVVVAQFAGTIAAVAILAALMPVVAAQGGNAGNQSMTIIVRSLALGQIDLKDFWKIFRDRHRPAAWTGPRCAAGGNRLFLVGQPGPERGHRHGHVGKLPGGGGGGRARANDPAQSRRRSGVWLQHDGHRVHRYIGLYLVSGAGKLLF